MSYLFKVIDKRVFPNPETLLISPFKEIWLRDKSKGKESAIEDFSYIEFVSSMRRSNPFRGYPESSKSSVVREAVITRSDWEVDKLIVSAIEKIKEFQVESSPSYSLLISSKKAIEELKQVFKQCRFK